MELIKSLCQERWQSADSESLKDLVRYRIPRREKLSDGSYRYFIVDLEGKSPRMVQLEGANGREDPLKHIANCELKIVDKQIVAINLDGDCVIDKNFR